MVSPVPGSTFGSSSVTFQWSAGSATAYVLTLGSSQNGGDIYVSNVLHVTSATVNNIPTDGRTVYVTLYSQVNGTWLSNTYTYKAFSASGTPTPTPTATPRPTATPTPTPIPTPTPTPGLIINATFDSSITTNPNATAIEAMINQAIAKYEALYSDQMTVFILFRYSTTDPAGNPLGSGTLAESDYVIYTVPWNTFISDLKADAKTSNDATANKSLPAAALSTNIVPSSANGRSIGLNTPPAMFSNGSVGSGGPYDGIVTLNSGQPFQFTRPVSGSNYDALRSTEHEMDEVLGLGSYLGSGSSNLRPQDLFSWSSPGARNISSSGTRYFSIDSGNTNIVGFNQNPNGDFGDWISSSCPQANPYVQNAFSCPGQSSDVTVTSPEGINLDVIGYDLTGSSAGATAIRPVPPPTIQPPPSAPGAATHAHYTDSASIETTITGTPTPAPGTPEN
jgi:hypothetical protein